MNAVVTQPSSKSWVGNYMWLVKREFWEHRALYIAPLVYAAIVLLVTLAAAFGGGNFHIDGISIRDGIDPNHVPEEATGGGRLAVYAIFATPFAVIAAFVTLYYALDALYADRRDRSVLFWKSLPLSDTETVLSKVGVAAFFGPALAIAIAIATLLVVLVIATIALAARGMPSMMLWTHIPVFSNIAFLLFMLMATILWYLPIWSWCLLASSWAKRAAFLWAVIPVVVLCIVEYQVFGTRELAELLLTRVIGVYDQAIVFTSEAINATDGSGAPVGLGHFLTPGRLFQSAQLWGGLAASAVMIAATVWVRRFREAS